MNIHTQKAKRRPADGQTFIGNRKTTSLADKEAKGKIGNVRKKMTELCFFFAVLLHKFLPQ